jgi:hypothetical protein
MRAYQAALSFEVFLDLGRKRVVKIVANKNAPFEHARFAPSRTLCDRYQACDRLTGPRDRDLFAKLDPLK